MCQEAQFFLILVGFPDPHALVERGSPALRWLAALKPVKRPGDLPASGGGMTSSGAAAPQSLKVGASIR